MLHQGSFVNWGAGGKSVSERVLPTRSLTFFAGRLHFHGCQPLRRDSAVSGFENERRP